MSSRQYSCGGAGAKETTHISANRQDLSIYSMPTYLLRTVLGMRQGSFLCRYIGPMYTYYHVFRVK